MVMMAKGLKHTLTFGTVKPVDLKGKFKKANQLLDKFIEERFIEDLHDCLNMLLSENITWLDKGTFIKGVVKRFEVSLEQRCADWVKFVQSQGNNHNVGNVTQLEELKEDHKAPQVVNIGGNAMYYEEITYFLDSFIQKQKEAFQAQNASGTFNKLQQKALLQSISNDINTIERLKAYLMEIDR